MSGIYIHIPFCKQACYYCDFHFSTNMQNKQHMVEAMKKELILRKEYLIDDKIETLYFGGGTPSLLDQPALTSLIDTVKTHYQLDPEAEITLEANPDDLSMEKLKELKELGINRLSIGIQSFDDQILSYFNRAHDSQMARQSVADAQEVGIENISIDLIFGVPNQSLVQLKKDLKSALALQTPHISIYGLTIEEDTVFGRWERQNKLTPLDEELASQHLQLIMDRLENAGYEQYEISNFSLPGYRSRHNSSYWAGTHYLGIGPAAHSYDGDSRQFNIAHNAKYLKALAQDTFPAEKEILSREEKITEMILTQLRKKEGLSLKSLKGDLGYDLHKERGAKLKDFQEEGLTLCLDEILTLTQKGKLLCDWITEELIP
ncbi:radical SAM family heme chaperone HemW [Reichenbachiella ulvae]|uniref:Heme chaperone HemW n=1 Tax=Reichenbachiella ulvae TaxID=2980104 RepID=A0ABT3CY90_9BACT|nr:radical SAM family heme chaperone HemW [Reichenbachiella ulvae]MCV9388660.1 radical SAM family heme chaperone HemW [Reichenbachiella ulvae]